MLIGIIFILLTLLITFMYLKLKHPFWFIQPVNHRFNFFYWGGRPREIRKDLPKKNKYFQPRIVFLDSDVDWKEVTEFICSHYLRGVCEYKPSVNEIAPYLKKSFVSLYYDNEFTNTSLKKKLIGMITSRPLYIKQLFKTVYYVDFLCIDKGERKKGMAQQLIQTHDYWQSHHSTTQVSLFRREDSVPYLVPLVQFNCVIFPTKTWKTSKHPIIRVTLLTMHLLYEFIQRQTIEMFIYHDIAALQELVRTNNVIIYMYVENDIVTCCYFFRKSSTFYEGKEILILYASFKGNRFIEMFKSITYLLKYSYLCVEEVGDNILISNNLKLKTVPIDTIKCGYYFYNFIHKQIKPQHFLILN